VWVLLWQQRDYGFDSQIGLEKTPEKYIDELLLIFDLVKRVLKDDGTLWVNIGDSFNENTGGYFDDKNNQSPSIGKNRIKTQKYQKNFPRRSLLMIPYRFAIAMIDNKKWTCRNHVIWKKTITQPTTAKNRFTIDYEPFFMFSKTRNYFFDKKKKLDFCDIFETNKERRSVWSLPTEKSTLVNHSAPYPVSLASIPISACARAGGVVLDPFMGSGTTAIAAKRLGFSFFGGDKNEQYCSFAEERIKNEL
jgi:DNA modification methylase